MKHLRLAAPFVVLVPLVTACASASAASKPAEPALVIPAPPPHVIPITPEPVIEPVAELPGTAAPNAVLPTRSGRGARDASRPQGTDARADAKPETTPAEVPAVPAPAAPAGPPPQLRTTDGPAAESAVRASIERTRNLLSTVDYRRLTPVLKKAYDDAKKFADQADEGLKQGNVVFAQGVAGKAETLARELAGR